MTRFSLVARNVGRNGFRSAATVLGVALAVIAFVALRTVIDAWHAGAAHANKDRLTTRHKVSYGLPLPRRYVDDIREHVSGIRSVTHCDWFGGRLATRPTEFFANLACAGNAFDVYPEIVIDPTAIAAWKRDKQGAVIGDQLAQRLGLRVGDRITLQGSFYAGDWPLTIVGIYSAAARTAVNRSSLFFRWDYKNERVPARQKDQVGWVFTRVDDPAQSPRVARAIDQLFDTRDVQTATMSERGANSALMGGVSAVLGALDAASGIVLAIMTLILGNTLAMGVRERTNEYGVMLALGFSPARLRWLILAEALSVALCGGLLGLALAYPLVQEALGAVLEENAGQFFPVVRIVPLTAFTAAALTVLLGVAAALLPARRIGRLSAADTLRRVA